MAEKVTVMVLVLKVDLACSCCYKKVKKVLCKFPQIRDEAYDLKKNTVTITVVCCDPEKIRDKLCCKGQKVIKSIEIKEPPKPKKKTELEDAEKSPNKDTKVDEQKNPTPTQSQPPSPRRTCCGPCSEGYGGGPCYHGHGRLVLPPSPGRTCCGPCSEGYGGGPCYHGYGRHVLPPPDPCYNGYEYRYTYVYGYGRNKSCCASNYFSEENPQGCTIM